jgi:MoaA/NifB/PqqE/SkfB family radical SAM enzyme
MRRTALDAIRSVTTPLHNLCRGRPVLAVFEVCLRCNSNCGYCDLPLNVGRYEMTRPEIRDVFTRLYQDGLRFLFGQGGEPLLRADLADICNMLCSRVVGSNLRQPVSALMTPWTVRQED